MTQTLITLAAGAAALALAVAAAAPAWSAQATNVKNIVLVHGAWADGSGWRNVYDILTKDGYNVSIVQNPLTSLADDVASVDRVLARQTGPVILVGHSYGGAVISEAGDDPKVAGLVYVAAFAPDVGETVFGLLPKSDAPPPFTVSADGFAFLIKDAYLHGFAPRRRRRTQRVHGGFAGSLRGPGRRQRAAHRRGLEDQAELVRDFDRRSVHPAGCPAHDG